MKDEREKLYRISCVINKEKNEFQVDITKGKAELVYQVIFGRDGIREKNGKDTGALLFDLLYKKEQVRIHYKRMTESEKNSLHEIFPYIPKFHDLETFYKAYCMENAKFSYEDYEALKRLMKELLKSHKYPSDETWKCVDVELCNETKKILMCKWQNHIVLWEGNAFCSNLSYDEICSMEYQFKIDNREEIELFGAAHPQLLFEPYASNGGNNLFTYLTSEQMNPVINALGRVGFAKLADNFSTYEEINGEETGLEAVFGLPFIVLQSMNCGEDIMLRTKADREILNAAYKIAPEIFLQPMTTITEMYIRYYFLNQNTYFAVNSNTLGNEFAKTVKYLNTICENYPNEYVTFVRYQNYLAYSEYLQDFLCGRFPSDLDMAEKMSAEKIQELLLTKNSDS